MVYTISREIFFQTCACVGDWMKTVIIFKNRYQIPKFTDLSDNIYFLLREFIFTKYIDIGFTLIHYYDIIRLAYFWSDLGQGTKVGKILAIGVGYGMREMALSKLLFPAAKLHLTSIISFSPYVEKLSDRDAIIKYSHCDLMIICWPTTNSKGYTYILENFHGKYIIFIGDSNGYHKDLDKQLEEWGHRDLVLKIDSREVESDLIVYRNRKFKK